MKNRWILILLILPLFINAQEYEKSNIQFKLKGFVKADYIFDTRQNVESREGFYIMYPKAIELDDNGIDINDKASANQYDMTTRVGLETTGPEIFNAQTSSLIEVDFTGPSNAHI